MKLTIIGAAGLRTPLIIDEISRRRSELGIDELVLMDINADQLRFIQAIVQASGRDPDNSCKMTWTLDPVKAIKGAKFVISTMRVGDMPSRVIDERIPLNLGYLGQETTGPGGFAMGLRTLPVLANYIRLIREYAPEAWLINFANPSGMMTEGIRNYLHFPRAVGICDGPSSMLEAIAGELKIDPHLLNPGYFGLNHLGWFKSIYFEGRDILPDIINLIQAAGNFPGYSIAGDIVSALGLLPNEYLQYYYYSKAVVQKLAGSGKTRGEILADLNSHFFARIQSEISKNSQASIPELYRQYLDQRSLTYHDTSIYNIAGSPLEQDGSSPIGYAGLALDLIESLNGNRTSRLILNIANKGKIEGMADTDVVEIPADVTGDYINPLPVGSIPDHCLGLMKQVKAFEKLTIEAALENSYEKALLALSIHPLVMDRTAAKMILDGYLTSHGDYFPKLR